MNKLEEARVKINEVDAKMAELFCQRMKAAEDVFKYKQQHGLKIKDSKREAEIIRRNSELVEDKVLREYYTRFLEQNMSLSCAYQERLMCGMKIAYSGTQGAFAHIAAKKLFPAGEKIGFADFEAAYNSVLNEQCDVAVLPVENSFHGEVGQVSDLMFSGPLFVDNMIELSVTQDLLGLAGWELVQIKEVVSHPQALGQCADYIKKKGLKPREFSNTALAAKYVAEKGDPSIVAIASREAADVYGLCVIEKQINSSARNTTRFAVFSRANNNFSAGNKLVHTIIMFTVPNKAGSLAKAINVIGKHDFNMINLRSRNMKELLWQYYFYVELEGDIASDNGKKMLEELDCCCDRLKIAGSFKLESFD